jgi:hypothetical protein
MDAPTNDGTKALVEVPADGEYQLRRRCRSVSISWGHGLQHSDPAFEIGAGGPVEADRHDGWHGATY